MTGQETMCKLQELRKKLDIEVPDHSKKAFDGFLHTADETLIDETINAQFTKVIMKSDSQELKRSMKLLRIPVD